MINKKNIFVIALVLLVGVLFVSSNVSANAFHGLTINKDGVHYDPSTGNLIVPYTPSNIDHIYIGKWWNSGISFPGFPNLSWNYTIEDNNAISYFVVYFDHPLDDTNKSLLDSTLSKSFFYASDFKSYCGKGFFNLIDNLNEVGLKPNYDYIDCFYNQDIDKKKQIVVTDGDFENKKTGAFYIYVLEYNVEKNRPYSKSNTANLDGIVKNSNRYAVQLIKDKSKIFNSSNNYFADKYVLKLSDGSSEQNKEKSKTGTSIKDVITHTNVNSKLNLVINNPKGNGYFCTKSNICYIDNKTISNLSISVTNYSQDADVNTYFYVDYLTTSNISIDLTSEAGSIINNNIIEVGSNLRPYIQNKNLSGKEFKIICNSLDKSYFISAAQFSNNVPKAAEDTIYLIPVSDANFSKLLVYNINKKILNLYCPNCLPDWLPFANLSNPKCPGNGTTSGNGTTPNNPACPNSPTGGTKDSLLSKFDIFNLNQLIGVPSVSGSLGSTKIEKNATFKDEFDHFYYLSKPASISTKLQYLNTSQKDNIKLFEKEKHNFNLSNLDDAKLFAVFAAESTFITKSVGDKNLKFHSYGIAQAYEGTWKKASGYNDLKIYLPKSINSPDKYYQFYNDAKQDANKSMYLGAAIFNYNLNKAKNQIRNWNSYSDVDKAFILFYAYQFNIDPTIDFFNHVNVPTDKAIVQCKVHHKQNYEDGLKTLGCVATTGAIIKLAWYEYYLNKHKDIMSIVNK